MSPFEDISSFWVQHNRDVKLVKVCWSDMHEHEISYAKKGVWPVYESPKLKDLIALHPLLSGVMRFGRTHSCGLQKITSRMRSGNPACLKVWIRHIWQESKRFVRQNSTKRLHTINTPSPTTQLTKLYCLIYIYIYIHEYSPQLFEIQGYMSHTSRTPVMLRARRRSKAPWQEPAAGGLKTQPTCVVMAIKNSTNVMVCLLCICYIFVMMWYNALHMTFGCI